MKERKSHIIVDSYDGLSKNWHTPFNKYLIRDFYGSYEHVPDNNLPLQILFVHEEHCFDKYYRKRENSEVFSIELVLEGSMVFFQDGKKYRVMPGEIYFVHLDRENEVSLGPEKTCHRLACCLTGKSLNNILHSTSLFERDVLKLQNPEKIESLMRKCLEEFKEMRPNYRLRAAAVSFELLLELSQNMNQTDSTGLIARAVEIMEHHLSRRLSLKQLANILGSSAPSLSRIFQKNLQESPINYFIHLKMEAAKSMLANTNLQIQEIAHRVGYENPLYFSTEFRKRTGQSPRQYRKTSKVIFS